MTLEVPVAQLPDFSERVTLDGKSFFLRFQWNDRANEGEGAWFLNIYDDQEVLLIAGLKVVVDDLIIEQYHHLDIPDGQFMPFDTTLRKEDPVLDDFGIRVLLIYLEAGEV